MERTPEQFWKRIWLDAGHGGKDPGAVDNGLLEKELVLKMQGYMIDYLRAHYEDFYVEATRTKDVFETLQGRARRANAWGADVFMSLHINAGSGTGFESFIYSQPSQASVALQNVVNQEALAVAKKYGLGVHGVANKRANYSVLRETAMPAILMETAYIDSKDAALLKNESFLRDMSEAYACGLAKFLGLKPIQKVEAAVSDGKKYRLKTGTFGDKATAERMAAELKQRYGWTVYIEEA
jgi:N-acetylmuramoyl-L-alanine amidase